MLFAFLQYLPKCTHGIFSILVVGKSISVQAHLEILIFLLNLYRAASVQGAPEALQNLPQEAGLACLGFSMFVTSLLILWEE